ncbi:hypothetical protein D3C72_1280550 [compost metagenome]
MPYITGSTIYDESICPCAACKGVITASARVQDIVAVAAVQVVRPTATIDRIVTIIAINGIVTLYAINHFGDVAAINYIVAGGSIDGGPDYRLSINCCHLDSPVFTAKKTASATD